MQYVPHVLHSGKHIFDRFAVLFTIVIVWIYAHLLTVGGAYNDAPHKTQISCRTDRAGLIDAAPWLVVWFYSILTLDGIFFYGHCFDPYNFTMFFN